MVPCECIINSNHWTAAEWKAQILILRYGTKGGRRKRGTQEMSPILEG